MTSTVSPFSYHGSFNLRTPQTQLLASGSRRRACLCAAEFDGSCVDLDIFLHRECVRKMRAELLMGSYPRSLNYLHSHTSRPWPLSPFPEVRAFLYCDVESGEEAGIVAEEKSGKEAKG